MVLEGYCDGLATEEIFKNEEYKNYFVSNFLCRLYFFNRREVYLKHAGNDLVLCDFFFFDQKILLKPHSRKPSWLFLIIKNKFSSLISDFSI